MDGLADARVGAATAEVVAHGSVDLGIGGMRRVGEQRGGGEDLAGLAVAALRDVELLPRELNRVGAVGGETLDGGDGATGDGADGGDAGAGGDAVDEDGAGPAGANAAAVLGTLEVEGIAQGPEERRVWGEIDGGEDVVDPELERHAGFPFLRAG